MESSVNCSLYRISASCYPMYFLEIEAAHWPIVRGNLLNLQQHIVTQLKGYCKSRRCLLLSSCSLGHWLAERRSMPFQT